MTTARQPSSGQFDVWGGLNPPDHFSVERSGAVASVVGTVIRGSVPGIFIGEACEITRADASVLLAEVVGFDADGAVLMPLEPLNGVSPGAKIRPLSRTFTVPAGPATLGRVIDALGRPIDAKGPLDAAEGVALTAEPPHALDRQPVDRPVSTGVRAIDALLTLGRGQRIGIFAGAGVGKSTLLASIARHVHADRVVLALIGERRREVAEFIDNDLGPEGLAKSTVVVSTSDEPAALRLKAALTATAVAEQARAAGQDVVLMMDSVTRYARALRELGLAAGEPPGPKNYPASVFAELPRLFERAGNDANGAITALYTVLVAGHDIKNEPIADEAKSLLDGHIVLADRLAQRMHYPAIDVIDSKSRVMNQVVSRDDAAIAGLATKIIADYEQNYDKISLGLYEHPADAADPDPTVWYPVVRRFLCQDRDDAVHRDAAMAQLRELLAGVGGS